MAFNSIGTRSISRRCFPNLDIEHYLGLRGKNTWSREGNQGQMLVKRLIAQIIHERTPSASQLPEVYLRFADRLDTSDVVITLNYDIVLERSLERVGKPYRLFPHRYSQIGIVSNLIDISREEVILLKMHGSVDWFDMAAYDEQVQIARSSDFPDYTPSDAVFDPRDIYGRVPIVDGPRDPNDPLLTIFRLSRVDEFYKNPTLTYTPWILPPSYSKVVYSSTLHDFWYGLGLQGGESLGLAIIGFSMPNHDNYLRQALYSIVQNYQTSWWDLEFPNGARKTRLKLIDLRTTDEERRHLEERYRFIDWSKAVKHLSGFNNDAVDLIFADDH